MMSRHLKKHLTRYAYAFGLAWGLVAVLALLASIFPGMLLLGGDQAAHASSGGTITHRYVYLTFNSGNGVCPVTVSNPASTKYVTTSLSYAYAVDSNGNEIGTAVTFTATPPAGYRFDGWQYGLVTSTLQLTPPTQTTLSITVTGGNWYVIPRFVKRIYLTTTKTGSGTGTITPASGLQDENATLTVTATPTPGNRFSGWSGAVNGPDVTLPSGAHTNTVFMDAPKTVTAAFTKTYTLSTTVQGSGSVSPSGGTYDSGTTVTLTATPAQGWEFVQWLGHASGTSETANVVMSANISVTAVFVQRVFTAQDTYEGLSAGALAPSPWQTETDGPIRSGIVVGAQGTDRFLTNGPSDATYAIIYRPEPKMDNEISFSYYFAENADPEQSIAVSTRNLASNERTWLEIFPERVYLGNRSPGNFGLDQNLEPFVHSRNTWYEVYVKTLGSTIRAWIREKSAQPWEQTLAGPPTLAEEYPLAIPSSNASVRLHMRMRASATDPQWPTNALRIDNFMIKNYANDDYPVEFPDPILKQNVREALEALPGGTDPGASIWESDLNGRGFTSLSIPFEDGVDPVVELAGLEHARDLQNVVITNQAVFDMAPLIHLRSLVALQLWENQIDDLTPILHLPQIKDLRIGYNPITDIYPITGLNAISFLGISGLPFDDISDAMYLMTQFHYETSLITPQLLVRDNGITVLDEFGGLPSRINVDVSGNPLTCDTIRNIVPIHRKRNINYVGISTECDFILNLEIQSDNPAVTITRSPEESEYAPGTTVTLTPNLPETYKISRWEGTHGFEVVDIGDGTYSLTMNEDKHVIAVTETTYAVEFAFSTPAFRSSIQLTPRPLFARTGENSITYYFQQGVTVHAALTSLSDAVTGAQFLKWECPGEVFDQSNSQNITFIADTNKFIDVIGIEDFKSLRLETDGYNDGTSSAVTVRGTAQVTEVLSGEKMPFIQLDVAGSTCFYTNASHVRIGYTAASIPDVLPPTPFTFLYWKVFRYGALIDTSTDESIELTLDADYKVQPIFEELYPLTVNIEPAGSGTIRIQPQQVGGLASSAQVTEYFPAGRENKGVRVLAAPNAGYAFSQWQGGSVNAQTDPRVSFDLTGPETLTATFVPAKTLSVGNSDGSLIIDPPNVLMEESFKRFDYPTTTPPEAVTLTPQFDAFVPLDHWVLDGEVIFNTGPLTVMMDHDHTVQSVFIPAQAITEPEIPSLLLTVAVGGSVQITHSAPFENLDQIVASNEGPLFESISGGSIQLSPIPETGFVFDHWTIVQGMETRVNSSNSLVLTSTAQVLATFRLDEPMAEHLVTISALGRGTVVPFVGQGHFADGESIVLDAMPEVGWRFARWEGDFEDDRSVAAMDVREDLTLQAVFEPNAAWPGNYNGPLYRLETQSDGGGTAIPKEVVYPEGTIVSVSALAAPGYAFDHWEGYPVNNDGEETVSFPLDQHTSIQPVFRRLVRFCSDSISMDNGRLEFSPPLGNGYEIGTMVTVTAIPDEGYTFDHWSGDLAKVAESTGTGFLSYAARAKSGSESITLEITPGFNLDFCASAIFKKQGLLLTLLSSPSGTIIPKPKKTSFDSDELVTLTAIPKEGFKLKSWTGDVPAGSGSGINQVSFLMGASNRTIGGQFERIREYFKVNVRTTGFGTVVVHSSSPAKYLPAESVPGEKSIYEVAAGSRVTFEITKGDLKHWEGGNITGQSIENLDRNYGGIAVFGDKPAPTTWTVQVWLVGNALNGTYIDVPGGQVGFAEWVPDPLDIGGCRPLNGWMYRVHIPTTQNVAEITVIGDFKNWYTQDYDGGWPGSTNPTIRVPRANPFRPNERCSVTDYERGVPFNYGIIAIINNYSLAERWRCGVGPVPFEGCGAVRGHCYYPGTPTYGYRLLGTGLSFNPLYGILEIENYIPDGPELWGGLSWDSADYPLGQRPIVVAPTYAIIDSYVDENGFRVLEGGKSPFKCELSLSLDPPEGGVVTGGGLFTQDEFAPVTITPNAGFLYLGRTGTTEMSVKMCSDIQKTIRFERDCLPTTLLINTSPTSGGIVTAHGLEKNYLSCSNPGGVTLRAVPDECHTFVGWQGDVGTPNPTSSTISLGMTVSRSVTPIFALDPNCGNQAGEEDSNEPCGEPINWWINNDWDGAWLRDGNEASLNANDADYLDDVINGYDDLEDFKELSLQTGIEDAPSNSLIYLVLDTTSAPDSGTPAKPQVNVYVNDQDFELDVLIGDRELSDKFIENAHKLGEVGTPDFPQEGILIPRNAISESGVLRVLIEGVTKAAGTIEYAFYSEDGQGHRQELNTGGFPMRMVDIHSLGDPELYSVMTVGEQGFVSDFNNILESTVFSVHCLGSSRSLSLHNSMARLTHSWVSLLNLV